MFKNLDDYVSLDEPKDIVLDWDNPWLARFSKTEVFQNYQTSLAELLPERRPERLEDSEYYKCVLERYRTTDLLTHGARLVACERAVDLLDSIRTNGFLKGPEWTQLQPAYDWHVGPASWYGPVVFGIDGLGQLIHHDGMHRAAAASLLNIPLPVRIVAQHKNWKRVYDALEQVHLYDDYPHPEFLNRSAVRKNSVNRFRRILEHLRDRRFTRVVDVGSCQGNWPVAAMRHYPVVAIEPSQGFRHMLKSWLHAEGKAYQIGVDWRQVKLTSTDVCTAFSVVHHIAKTREGLDEFVRFLKQTNTVILEVPNNKDSLWHAELRQEVSQPWSYINDHFLQTGYRTAVLYVDRQHDHRQTICYAK